MSAKIAESRKRSSDAIDSFSGVSFAEALRMAAAPAPKKAKIVPAPPKQPIRQVFEFPKVCPVPPKPKQDSEEFGIERKHGQTKVYSGRSKRATDAATGDSIPTMNQLLQKPSNFDFEKCMPVLNQCTSDQLEKIERLNPRWQQLTTSLWQKQCLKAFPKATQNSNESWKACFKRCEKERDMRLAEISARIRGDYKNLPTGAVKTIKTPETISQQTATSTTIPLSQNPHGRSSRTASTKPPAPKRPAPMMRKVLQLAKKCHRR